MRRRPRYSGTRRPGRLVTVSEFSRSLINSGSDHLSPRVRRIIRLVAGAVVLYLFVAGNMGAWRLFKLWRAEHTMENRELQLAAEIVSLETRRQMLLNDTTYIEKIARTEYHLSRPNELIYVFDEAVP